MKKTDAKRDTAFAPIVGADARVLILGTMPSAVSLEKRQYYGHARNAFWPVVCTLLGEPVDLPYDMRCDMLRRHRIALWDVLESCVRPGSLDSAIRAEIPNDFNGFFAAHPRIHTVVFNGKGAQKLFAKHVLPGLEHTLNRCCLPATSPAYTLAFARKLEGWQALLGALREEGGRA